MTATSSNPSFDPHDLLAEARLGVLATIKASGMPQLSPVTPFYDRAAGVIKSVWDLIYATFTGFGRFFASLTA